MPKKRIILASASPRRQELLKNAGIEFEVRAASIDEVPHPGESPVGFAERMAKEKARAVGTTASAGQVVLGADTVVTIDNQILGKPEDKDDALRMLRLLSGRKHEVITAVCLSGVNSSGKSFEDVRSAMTAVYFSQASEQDIREYVGSGEPMDKAGAYASQGGAARWIRKIEGDYNNVVGLPVDLVLTMLREHGVV